MAAQSTSHQAPGASQKTGRPTPQSGQHSTQERPSGQAPNDLMDAARQTGEQLKDSAQQTADNLKQTGQDFMTEQKAKAANELSTLSAAVRSAAEKLRDGQDDRAARYAEMAAERLEGVARYLGDQDLRSLVREVERAARRRPELFLGGMFLVGLGVSRFLKASHPEEKSPRSYSSP
jgi:hypothetical protein